jgi:two-component system, NtrC family, sensor histidine kinase PilS
MTDEKIPRKGSHVSDAFQTALNLTGLGLLLIDKDRILKAMNPSASSMLGLTPEALGRDVLDVLPAWCEPYEALTSGSTLEFTLGASCASEGLLSVVVASPDECGDRVIVCRELPAPICNQGRPSGTELLIRLDRVMARLSHDMRNPLASLLAGLQALERAGSLSSDDSFMLKLLLGEVRTAIGIVERFTNSLRIDMNTVSRVPVNSLIQDTLSDLSDRARKQQVSLGVIPGTPDAWVLADERSLTRALGKLVKNGIEACENGGRIDLGWRVLSEAEKQEAFPKFMGEVIAIFGRDTGCGLPPNLPEIVLFDPFVTTKPSAAGLGLPVARHIVENHAGVIALHPLVSGGTEFEVFLPLGYRMDCWEVMQQQRGGTDVDPCENCEVKLGKAREFCWAARHRWTEPPRAFPPHTCEKCPFFGAFNLVSARKPALRS